MNESDANGKSSPTADPFRHQPDGSTGSQAGGSGAPGEWQRLKQQSGELLEYLSYYLHAKADSLKLTGRRLVFHIKLEIVALLVMSGTILVGVTFIFGGIAQGLAQLFGNQTWLGHLVAGLLLLGCAGLGGWLWRRAGERHAYKQTVEKYEQRKREQQTRFGHNVAERAQGTRSKK